MESFYAYALLALRLLMGAALFGFLGWAFYTLWRDLNNQAQNAAKQRVPALQVTLASSNGAAEALRFSTNEVVIGRHPGCEWMLIDETVSSRHARLTFHHEQWWLEDLGSRNGTFLNGEALAGPVVLAENDQVSCGQVSFTIAFEESEER